MAILTASLAKALELGVRAWWGQSYKDYDPIYPKIFDTHKSKSAWEEDTQYTGQRLAPIIEEGEGVTYETHRQGPTTQYRHVEIGTGFIISKNAFEDNRYPQLTKYRTQIVRRAIEETREVMATNILNRVTTAGYELADGVTLGSTAHPYTSSGGTWSNLLSPSADISEAAIESLCIMIMETTDDNGIVKNHNPVLLIVTPSDAFDAKRILYSDLQNDTANNATNALNGYIKKGYLVNPRLTDSDAFFITTDVPDGMKYYSRRKDELQMTADFDTGNLKTKVTARFSFGVTDPRAVFTSTGGGG